MYSMQPKYEMMKSYYDRAKKKIQDFSVKIKSKCGVFQAEMRD